MTEERKPQSWWQTIPGLLTAAAGIITAVTGLIVALSQTGFFGSTDQPPSPKLAKPPATAPSAVKPRIPPAAETTSSLLGGAAKTAYFVDDFSGDKLKPHWKILDPNPGKWTLQPGKNSLLIITEKGSIAGSNRNLKNQFVLDLGMPKGNYEIIVKASMQIQGTGNTISIGLFRDDDNFLELSYWGRPSSNIGFPDGVVDVDFYRTRMFVKEERGKRFAFMKETTPPSKGPSISPQTFLLKIERDGNQYTGSFAFLNPARPPQPIDDVSWIKVGTHAWIDFDSKFSLWARNIPGNIVGKGPPPEVAAEFDFILIRER